MTIKELNRSIIPIVSFNPKLERYKDIVLFPDKLNDANAFLKKAGLPNDETRKNSHALKHKKAIRRHTLSKKKIRKGLESKI
jgi:hypothetical protein